MENKLTFIPKNRVRSVIYRDITIADKFSFILEKVAPQIIYDLYVNITSASFIS